MIRPELVAVARRWAEPALATAATLFALWVAGLTTLRWGWVTLVLSAIIGTAGGLWVREAIRRVRFASGGQGGGRVFVEEGRILYVGGVGNVQIDLADVIQIDLAVSRPTGLVPFAGKLGSGAPPASAGGPEAAPTEAWTSVLLHTQTGHPAAVPLNAEGQDALIDALCTLPGFHFEALNRAIQSQKAKGRFAPLVTFWRRTL